MVRSVPIYPVINTKRESFQRQSVQAASRVIQASDFALSHYKVLALLVLQQVFLLQSPFVYASEMTWWDDVRWRFFHWGTILVNIL